MSGTPVRVIKLGGSLLDWSELVPALRNWRMKQPAARDVLVAGGGALVEALRHLDHALALPKADAHWLAVDLMGTTARMLRLLLNEAVLVDTIAQLTASHHQELHILDVTQFLRDDAKNPAPLPCDWQVTSDSICARLAIVMGAAELVLLKSSLPARGDLASAAETGYLDPYCPQAAAGLKVRCVNLRDPSFTEATLQ